MRTFVEDLDPREGLQAGKANHGELAALPIE
jgi:hypothetical protein